MSVAITQYCSAYSKVDSRVTWSISGPSITSRGSTMTFDVIRFLSPAFIRLRGAWRVLGSGWKLALGIPVDPRFILVRLC